MEKEKKEGKNKKRESKMKILANDWKDSKRWPEQCKKKSTNIIDAEEEEQINKI